MTYPGSHVGHMTYPGSHVGHMTYPGSHVGHMTYAGSHVGHMTCTGSHVGHMTHWVTCWSHDLKCHHEMQPYLGGSDEKALLTWTTFFFSRMTSFPWGGGGGQDRGRVSEGGVTVQCKYIATTQTSSSHLPQPRPLVTNLAHPSLAPSTRH